MNARFQIHLLVQQQTRDPSCKKESTSNITDVNCFDARDDGPTICNEAQTPFVPSGAN